MAQNWHNEYADRKNGRKPVDYPHADLEEILAPTYGLMIYQEQLMRVAQRLAGYSLEEADNLRKATGKKIRALIAKERTKFVDGLRRAGPRRARSASGSSTPSSRSPTTRSTSRTRSGYGFVAYQTAYLKANHPVEYLAALLTQRQDQQGPDRGLPQRVPPARASRCSSPTSTSRCPTSRCATGPMAGAIRFGLSAVRNVGEGVVVHIVAARDEGGPFTDFYDFCDRVDPTVLNKRTIESLIKAGAFDSLGHPRQGLVFVYETIVETVLGRRRNEAEGQFDLFSAVDDPAPRGGRRPAHRRSPTPSSRSRSGSRSRRRCSGST